MRTATLITTAGAALMSLSATSFGAPMTFFGQDVNLNANHDTVPLGAFPNSLAASADFGNHIINRQIFSFETSEGVTANTSSPAPPPPAPGVNPAVNFNNGITASITNGVVRAQAPGTATDGRYPTSGTQYLAATFGAGSAIDLRLDFNQPVSAFGFFGIDIGDFGAQLRVTTTGGLNMLFTIPHTVSSGGGTSGSVMFWGIIDPNNSFTSVQFSALNNPGGDVFAFDDFTIGSIEQVCTGPTCVPLPTGMGLGLAGFFGLGAVSFARRQRA